MTAKTPFDGYESITLSGKLGTTSLGRQMGVSFEQNKVRRDLSVSYEEDQNHVAMVHVKTPLEKYKSVKLRSMMMADMGTQMEFAFETQGDQNDMAVGLLYDFSKGLSNGMLLFKIRAAPFDPSLSNLEAKIEYNNVDGNPSNGFDGMFYFSKDNEVVASGKITRVPGHTTVEAKTPFRGYKNLELELKSDYSTNVFMSLDKDGQSISLNVDKVGPSDYDIIIKTPSKSYEKITCNIRKDDKTTTVDIFKNDKKFSTFTVVSDVSIEDGRGHIDFKWEATDSLWAQAAVSYEDNKAEFSLKAPNTDWKVSMEVKESGPTSTTKFDANIDGEVLRYSSERTWTDGHIVGQSEFFTTMPYFKDKDTKSNYEITYPNDLSFNRPLEIYYESKNSGVTDLLLKSKLEIVQEKSVKISVYLSNPSKLPNDIDLEFSVVTDQSNTLTISGKFNKDNISIKLEKKTLSNKGSLTEKEYSFHITTTVPGFEKIMGKATDKTEQEDYGMKMKKKIDFQLQLNGMHLLKGSMLYDKIPFTTLKMAVFLDDDNYQKFSLKWSPNYDNQDFSISVKTEGFSNVDATASLTRKAGAENLEMTVKGSGVVIGDVDFVIKMKSKHNFDGNGKFQPGMYGLKAMLRNNAVSRSSNELKLEMFVDIPEDDFEKVSGKIWVQLPIANGKSYGVSAGYDFKNTKKTLEAKLDLNNHYEYSMKGEIEWSPESADIVINVDADGKTIKFIGKRHGYEKFLYQVDVFGKKILFKSENELQSPTDFMIDATLSFPYRYRDRTWSLKMDSKSVSSGTGIDADAEVKVDGQNWEIKCSLQDYKSADAQFEFKLGKECKFVQKRIEKVNCCSCIFSF